MTIELKSGAENVLESLKHVITEYVSPSLPGFGFLSQEKIRAYRAQSYVFNGSLTLSFTLNKGAPIVVSIPDNTYTATALAAQLNGDATFNASLIAGTMMQDRFLTVQQKLPSIFSSLRVNDTAGAAVLGWQDNYAMNYILPREFGQVEFWFDNVEPIAYPACTLFCDSYEETEPGEMMRYDVRLRVYETVPDPSWGQALYRVLMRYAFYLKGVLTPAQNSLFVAAVPELAGRSLLSQVNAINLTNITFNPVVEVPNDGRAALFRGWLEMNLQIDVQENDY